MDRRIISTFLLVLVVSIAGGEENGVKDERVVVEEVKRWGLEREVEEKLVWWIEWMGYLKERQKREDSSSWLWKKGKDGFYLSHRWKLGTRGALAICFFPFDSQDIKCVTFYTGIDNYEKGKLSGRYDVWFLVTPQHTTPGELRVVVDGIELQWWGESEDITFQGEYSTFVRGVPPPKFLEVGELRIPLYWEEFWKRE